MKNLLTLPTVLAIVATLCSLPGCILPSNEPVITAGIELNTDSVGTKVSILVWRDERVANSHASQSGDHTYYNDFFAEPNDYGTLESLSCVPAQACADLSIVDGKGSFIAAAASFQIHSVGTYHGTRVEWTEDLTFKMPVGEIVVGAPEGAASKGVVHACLRSALPAILEMRTPEEKTSVLLTKPDFADACADVKVVAGATLVARLVKPAIVIATLKLP
jgi:hypothetical protein